MATALIAEGNFEEDIIAFGNACTYEQQSGTEASSGVSGTSLASLLPRPNRSSTPPLFSFSKWQLKSFCGEEYSKEEDSYADTAIVCGLSGKLQESMSLY